MQFTKNPFTKNSWNTPTNNIEKAGTDPQYGCINVLILDESSSMSPQSLQTKNAVNGMLKEMASDEKNKVIISTFNGRDVRVSDLLDPTQVKLSYNPNGMTNLYDAIIETINKVNYELSKTFSHMKPVVIFQIMTDGHENSSKNSSYTVKNLISRCEENEWTFTFVGADIDPFSMARDIGINTSAITVIDKANYDIGFNNATSAYNSIKTMRKMGLTNDAIYASASIWSDQPNANPTVSVCVNDKK